MKIQKISGYTKEIYTNSDLEPAAGDGRQTDGGAEHAEKKTEEGMDD